MDGPLPRCSFCGKREDQVDRMIWSNTGAHICNECVEVCVWILKEEGLSSAPAPRTTP